MMVVGVQKKQIVFWNGRKVETSRVERAKNFGIFRFITRHEGYDILKSKRHISPTPRRFQLFAALKVWYCPSPLRCVFRGGVQEIQDAMAFASSVSKEKWAQLHEALS